MNFTFYTIVINFTNLHSILLEELHVLYNHKANGDSSVLNCPQTDTEDDHLILRKAVKAAVRLLKKGKSGNQGKLSSFGTTP